MPLSSESGWGYNASTGGLDVGTYTGNSCLFSGSDEFLTKTWGSAASDLDSFTISMWIKRTKLDSGSTQYWLVGALTGAESNIKIQADKINVHLTGSNYDFVGTRLLRDTSAWYHLVFRYDSDEASAGDRFRCYINGELETWASSSTIPSGTDNQFFANTNQITIGAYDASNHRFNGYIAQVVAIDGESLPPSAFAHQSPDTNSWVMEEPPVAEAAASGGNTDEQISGEQFYKHVFTSNGTLTVTQAGMMEYLVVGGGGSGGSSQNAAGGGGGAGAFRTGTIYVPAGSYSITVGAGGAQSGTSGQGNDGAASVFHTITSSGGGGGGYGANNGRASQGLGNGSGGGAGYGYNGADGGDYGNDGGDGGGGSTKYGAGGGGGASAAGANGSTTAGGNGGAGTASTITGSSVTYAGGGGGSTAYGGTAGTASGGGGAGGAENSTGTAGTANTGGGGGGAGGVNANAGGAGGSGIVVIRYFKPSSFDFGDNGFLLEFKETGTGTASTSTIGADTSGKTNHLTSTNLASTDSALTDTPINNFWTMTDLVPKTNGEFREGNRTYCRGTNASHGTAYSIPLPSTGKWYVEVKTGKDDNNLDYGIVDTGVALIAAGAEIGGGTNDYVYRSDGNKKSGGSSVSTDFDTYTDNDIISIAFDADNGKIWFAKNGTYQGAGSPNPATGADAAYTSIPNKSSYSIATSNAERTGQDEFNFGLPTFTGTDQADGNGHGSFEYAPPSGFLALCTKNLPEIEIGQEANDLAHDFFNTVIYTGNGSSGLSVTGMGFTPGLLWTMPRSSGDNGHQFDIARGTTKKAKLNAEDAEDTNDPALITFESDGFDIDTTDSNWNGNTNTYVAWGWKLGTAVSGTTTGSGDDEAYSGQVSADSGVGCLKFVGNGSSGHTIPHHLNSAPEFIVSRRTNSSNAWFVYHIGNTSAPETDYLSLDTDAATNDQAAMWNDTAPSSSVITVGDSSGTNADTDNYVLTYMHSVEGFSKFGSYIGNSSADGPFVHTGFPVAWLMVKKSDASGTGWGIFDSKRDTYNEIGDELFTNNTDAEGTGDRDFDFLSNGFKCRRSSSYFNNSGNTFIFIAFSSGTGFKYANAKT
tara:strand:+ start:61 stop:3345 length:3285 start_codon:yes stop_codon:yes gene_type:complete